jgi:hypothetical protein
VHEDWFSRELHWRTTERTQAGSSNNFSKEADVVLRFMAAQLPKEAHVLEIEADRKAGFGAG